jgi:hypothetical protein
MRHPGLLRGLGHRGRLRELLFWGEVIPEEGDTVRPMGTVEGASQGPGVVHVRGDHLGPGRGELPGLRRIDVAGERASTERPALVGQDGPHQTAALRAGGSHHRNDFLLGHDVPPRWNLNQL